MDITQAAPVVVRSASLRPGFAESIATGLRELWERRRLIAYLVGADLRKKGADTILGNVWWILDPLLQMLVYVVLVSLIFARPQPDYPLFIFAAILPWKWFTSSVIDAIGSVSSQDRLIKQIQFPKIVLPTAATLAGIVHFGFGLIALGGLLLVLYPDRLSPYLLLIPAIAAVQLVFTLAVGYVVAAVNVFYRDVSNLARHALRLWFYLSPALYGASAVERLAAEHPRLVDLFRLNPFFVLFTAYRNVIYGAESGGGPIPPDWTSLGVLLAVSLGLVALAIAFFKRFEPAFAKVL
ncbi:MAG TPA: ABC transporter permease [Candidatus Limnocylindrales bacterium]|nr:ABC transporter permease [Candidatus Limnocylindrales bacterium]